MTRNPSPRHGWMRLRRWAVALLVPACLAVSQTVPPADDLGTIHGRLLDTETGAPIAHGIVRADTTRVTYANSRLSLAPGQPEDGFATTGEDGRFTLRRVPAGARTIHGLSSKGIFNETSKRLQLGAGETIEDFELRLRDPATISGRAVDEKGEPLARVQVSIVHTEYHAGEARHYLRHGGLTDHAGEYRIENVNAGRSLRLLAVWTPPDYDALTTSRAPEDPRLRRPAYSRSFYPDSPTLEGGTALTLRSGEERHGVDFVMRRETSRCIEGKLIAPADVTSIQLSLQLQQPSYGSTRRGGTFGQDWSAKLEGERNFRICQLCPGDYTLRANNSTVGMSGSVSAYGVAAITVTDRDVTGLEIPLVAPYRVRALMEWAGSLPHAPPADPARVLLEPLFRSSYRGETRSGQSAVPGETELAAVLVDDYAVTARAPAAARRPPDGKATEDPRSTGLYIKDVRYGDESVRYKPLRIGSKPADTPIRVLLDHGAGSVTARVTDTKGKAAGDSHVYLLPADASDAGELAEALLAGQTDQYGVFTWQNNVPPGAYRAVATATSLDYSPEAVDALWDARSRVPEFHVSRNGSAEVTVKLLDK